MFATSSSCDPVYVHGLHQSDIMCVMFYLGKALFVGVSKHTHDMLMLSVLTRIHPGRTSLS